MKNNDNYEKKINSIDYKYINDFSINNIYNCNNIDLIDKLIENNIKVDAIITDPPYNISRKNHFNTIGRKGIDFGEWDKNFNQLEWLENIDKIIAPNGSIIIFNDWKNMGEIAKKLEQKGFEVKDLIRWIKPNPMPRNVNRRYVTDFEFAIWAVNKNGKWTFNKPKEKPYLKPEYLFASPQGNKRIHPTQKPTKLIEEIIKTHTNEGDLILDLFSGSGEICLCAYNLKRSFIGCEIDKKYYENSLKRFNNIIPKPAFNHLGNKRRMILDLIKTFPTKNINDFVDVFAGSGIVSSTYKYAKKVHLNEYDKNLYNILEFLCNNNDDYVIQETMKIIDKFNLPKGKFQDYKEQYNKLKDDYNNKKVDNPIAALFTLILYGFNQQIRINSNGYFNIPVGKFFWTEYQEQKIREFIISNAGREKHVTNKDFEDFINDINEQINKDTAVYYFDPPYFVSNATYNSSWTENDESRLINLLEKMIAEKRTWFLSNQLRSKDVVNEYLLDFILKHKQSLDVFKINVNYKNSNYQRNNKNEYEDIEILIKGKINEIRK